MAESTPAPDASPTPAPAPADLVPRPSGRAVLGWYALAVAAAAVLIAAGLRLDLVSLREPLEYDIDALLIMPMVKNVVEGRTHWRNERMGYPGVYELYDFPVVDHLHLAVIWAMGRVVPDWMVVFNLYHLLTWPLTTLTAMYAFRRLGLTLPFAAAGGLLYAFQPYHYYRGEAHYFLAAYWLIPLSWLPALALCKGDLPFFARRPDGTYAGAWRTRAAGRQVLLAAATASAGAYYAFFACLVYAVAGLYAGCAYRAWRAGVSAAALAGLVAAFGVLNHAPAVAHAWAYGRAAVTERSAWESEQYGLKLVQLVLPIDGHNVLALRRVRAAYTGSFHLNNENAFATLGAIGTAGLLGLFAVLFVPNRLGWPYRPAAAVALGLVLFATVGGFGAAFNLLVFDQIRCLNRVSIYLAFLCLLAPLWWADRRLAGWPARRRAAAAVAVVAVGVADQTPGPWFTRFAVADAAPAAARFRDDRRFFARVEELAPGARVFCLPYMPFPEVPPLHGVNAYEHARVFLHSDTLVAGYGAIKSREADEWLKSVSFDTPANRLRRLVVRGFDGVFIDGRGYLTQADANRVVAEIKNEIPRGVAAPEVIHDDGRQVYLDLRPYRDWLRQQSPEFFDREAAREREWVALCFLRGFPSHEAFGQEHRHRLGYRTAVLQFVNPSDRDRTFTFEATFNANHEGEFQIRIAGGAVTWADKPGGAAPWADELTVGRERGAPRPPGVRRAYRLVIPPGRTAVRFTCTPPPDFVSPDARPTDYFLSDIKFAEVR